MKVKNLKSRKKIKKVKKSKNKLMISLRMTLKKKLQKIKLIIHPQTIIIFNSSQKHGQ